MTNIINRRAALGRIVAAASLVLPAAAIAAVPSDPDAEIVALSAEIIRRAYETVPFKERLEPIHERFVDIMHDEAIPQADRWGLACAYSKESGHHELVDQLEEIEAATDTLFKRLMTIPATTQAGRAAKVRALLAQVMPRDWRGPANDLDWDKEMARALLGEFAGMSAEELEAV